MPVYPSEKAQKTSSVENEWVKVKLGDCLIAHKQGKKHKKGKKPKHLSQKYSEGVLPYATAEYFRTCKAVDFVPVDCLDSCVHIKKDDLIIIWDGNAGEVFIGREDSVLASTMALLEVNKTLLDTKFCYFFLKAKFEILNQHSVGSVIPHVSSNILTNLEIPLPPLPEQKQISALLGTIEKAIALERQCEESLTTIKRAAMHVVFTKGLHNEAQRETPLGLVPESWGFSSLGSIAEINYGAQASVADATNPDLGTLILTNVNLGLDGYINLEKRRYYEIPEIHKDRLSLKKGDVLFNWRSGSKEHIGKSVFFDLDESCTYSSFILRFRVQHSVASKFLYYWLTYLRVSGFFITQRNVSSINSVYNASLSATIPIYFPDKTRQQEIVDFLTTLDQKLDIHRRKRACLENIFRLFLPNLTRGTLRFTDLPEGCF